MQCTRLVDLSQCITISYHSSLFFRLKSEYNSSVAEKILELVRADRLHSDSEWTKEAILGNIIIS